MVRDDAFGAEFPEQRLREKDRHDRSGEGWNRSPSDRRAIAASTAAKERRHALEVVICAVREGEKAGRMEKKCECHSARKHSESAVRVAITAITICYRRQVVTLVMLFLR